MSPDRKSNCRYTGRDPLARFIYRETRNDPVGASFHEVTAIAVQDARRSVKIRVLEIRSFRGDASDREATLAAISEIRDLEGLTVNGIRMSELRILGTLPNLKSFGFRVDEEDNDEACLAAFLARNTSIESLCLVGADRPLDFKLLGSVPKLRRLRWTSEAIKGDELLNFRLVPELRELKLTSCSADSDASDEDLRHLLTLRELRNLAISSVKITDKGLAHLAELPNLEQLQVHLGGSGLKHLGMMKKLKALSIHARYYPPVTPGKPLGFDLTPMPSDFDEENFSCLAKASNMESIELPEVIKTTDVSAEAFSRMPQLKQLILPGSAMAAAGYRRIFESPNCSIVRVRVPVSDEIVAAIADASVVQLLEPVSGKISTVGFGRLAKLRSLRILDISLETECDKEDVCRFAKMRPDITVICPQHGLVLRGARVAFQQPVAYDGPELWASKSPDEYQRQLALISLLRAIRDDDMFIQSAFRTRQQWMMANGIRADWHACGLRCGEYVCDPWNSSWSLSVPVRGVENTNMKQSETSRDGVLIQTPLTTDTKESRSPSDGADNR